MIPLEVQTMTDKTLSKDEQEKLLKILKDRFENNMHRHPNISWDDVEARLRAKEDKLWSLNEMERTEGEPDVIGYDEESDMYIFCDCTKESPKGRRSICYDREALLSRKKHPPKTSAMDMATEMGIDILTEEQYRALQEIEEFDMRTSTWIKTPEDIRALGGALFCDRRYDHVFTYHNGADSYYASRGFRGILKV